MTLTDELRHILGNETTRRGVFDLFDLFQYQTLNKRLLSILIENVLVNLFQNEQSSNQTLIISSSSSIIVSPTSPSASTPNNFVVASLHLHLTESRRVKCEWKLKQNVVSTAPLLSSNSLERTYLRNDLFEYDDNLDENEAHQGTLKRKTSISRSKSLMNEIKC